MIGGAGPLLDFLALFVEGGGARVVRDQDMAAFAMDDHGDASTVLFRVLVHFLRVGFLRQAAHFKNERRFLVVVENELCIRRLAVVFVPKPATDAGHARRQSVFAQEPPGNVHLMNALVAQIAAAIVPKPVPVVMNRAILGAVAPWRDQRRRPAPQIVVDVIRDRLRADAFPYARPALVTEAECDVYFPEIARADPFNRLFDAIAGTALRAGLDDFAILARGFDRLAPFPDVVRNGLFHVNILAHLHRPDSGERVPVIGRCDGDGV